MRYRLSFVILLMLSTGGNLFPRTGGNLYRIQVTREGEPVRLVFVRSLKEIPPEEFLRDNLGYESMGIARERDKTIFYEKRDRGHVPILCFHRIGPDPRYELTLENTHHLMAALIQNGYFPLSDRDFASGNFSLVPSGLKPFVIGADDASHGQVVWTDDTLRRFGPEGMTGDPDLDPDCLAAVFSRYFPPVRDRYNLTFYVSFDAVPFRQTGGIPHNGPPYRGLPVVKEKMNFIYQRYYLGHHSLTHTSLEDQPVQDFIDEIEECNRIFSEYLDRDLQIPSLAYPYGVTGITDDQERAFVRATDRGGYPASAFDLDGELADLPWSRRYNPWRIPRLSVENRSFNSLLRKLERRDIYRSRRTVLLYSDRKNFDLDSYNLVYGGDDVLYVYIP